MSTGPIGQLCLRWSDKGPGGVPVEIRLAWSWFSSDRGFWSATRAWSVISRLIDTPCRIPPNTLSPSWLMLSWEVNGKLDDDDDDDDIDDGLPSGGLRIRFSKQAPKNKKHVEKISLVWHGVSAWLLIPALSAQKPQRFLRFAIAMPIADPPKKQRCPRHLVSQCSATRDTVACDTPRSATRLYAICMANLRCDTPPKRVRQGLFLRHSKGCSAIPRATLRKHKTQNATPV